MLLAGGVSKCLLLKKQIELDLGHKLTGRPDALDLSEPEHKLFSPSEKPFGDLPIDSGFMAKRQFAKEYDTSIGAAWFRGRVEKSHDKIVLFVQNKPALLTSENKELLSYLDQLAEDSIVDIFGQLSGGEAGWSISMSQLYGISESVGEERSQQEAAAKLLRCKSKITSFFREVISAHEFVEVGSISEANEALRLDIPHVYCVTAGTRMDVIMEIQDNYLELVALVSFILERFSSTFPGFSEGAPILTFKECCILTGQSPTISQSSLDGVILRKAVKEKFNADCFVIDKLPRQGDAMPDPYNADVCNLFIGYCCGQEILRGQQNVHDATRIHQRTQIHTHQGTMPHGSMQFDIDILAKIVAS